MVQPRIVPLTQFLRHPALRLPSLPPVSERVRLFVVVSGGGFGGRRWYVGDLVVCQRRANQVEGQVMLEARGLGRPRLGTLVEGALFGDGGEACSPARWRVAGEVVAVLRSDKRRQLGEPGEGIRHGGVPGWRLIALTEGAFNAVFEGVEPRATSPAPGGGGGVAPLRVVSCSEEHPPGGRAGTARAQLPLFDVARARAA
jgi:hypothetical protein